MTSDIKVQAMARPVTQETIDASSPLSPTTTAEPLREGERDDADRQEESQYRVYKRRWLGLLQLVLLNTMNSWDVSAIQLEKENSFSSSSAR
jgi:hypothetical protein